MNDAMDKIIRAVSLGDGPLGDVEYDAATATWFTGVVIEDGDGGENAFELEFQFLPGEAGVTPDYLVAGWVVVPPDELKGGAANDLGLLQLINTVNSEAGAKFRLQAGTKETTSLVCEVDLPAAGLTTAALQAAVERSRDLVAAYFDELAGKARG